MSITRIHGPPGAAIFLPLYCRNFVTVHQGRSSWHIRVRFQGIQLELQPLDRGYLVIYESRHRIVRNYVATPFKAAFVTPSGCVRSPPVGVRIEDRAWNERFYGLLPSPVCKFVLGRRSFLLGTLDNSLCRLRPLCNHFSDRMLSFWGKIYSTLSSVDFCVP